MKIIFAQGNPGREYEFTRHNVGFYLIDQLARAYGATFSPKPKFHAEIAEATVEGEKILFVKPTTFYNETGSAARQLLDFYKCNPKTDFLVIHDDFALPFGTIRTRTSGSDAGNNGIKSLNAHLGMHYARIRVGIYHELRDHMPDVDFVLGKFSKDEKNALEALVSLTKKFVEGFIANKFELTKVSIKLD